MRFGALLLILLSIPASADSLLCIAEHVAWIIQDGDKLTESRASAEADHRYLVSESGVKHFGTDEKAIESCTLYGDDRAWCENEYHLESFFIFPDNIFRYLGVRINNETGEYSHFIVMGKCEKTQT